MNIRFNEDPFAKNAQGKSKIYHGVLLLMKFLQMKRHFKNKNLNYFDLYYTVNKNSDDKQIVNDEYQIYENHFISLNDVIMQNHYVGIKGREK